MSDTIKTGTVTGTGAAINISLGWKPDYVRVLNVTDGDTVDEWVNGMAAGTAITIAAAAASRSSNGISQYDGTISEPPGFTIGSGISESAKTLAWVAMRNKP